MGCQLQVERLVHDHGEAEAAHQVQQCRGEHELAAELLPPQIGTCGQGEAGHGRAHEGKLGI